MVQAYDYYLCAGRVLLAEGGLLERGGGGGGGGGVGSPGGGGGGGAALDALCPILKAPTLFCSTCLSKR